MKTIRLFLWAALFLLRFGAVVLFVMRAIEHGDIGCGVWACVELHALVLALTNEIAKEDADDSALGLLVPLLYFAGAFVTPVGTSSFSGQVAIGSCAVAVFIVRLYLGTSYSVAGSTWSGLRERGPYRWIRHPMLFCQMLTRLVVVAEFPNVVNLATLVFFVSAMMFVIALEERFLMTVEEYREYSSRVRYRLLPGVW